MRTMGLMLAGAISALPVAAEAAATRLCLDGRFDLGRRLQGHLPDVPELHRTRWCLVRHDDGQRVALSIEGMANSDQRGDFAQVYPGGDVVRIVQSTPPDLDFVNAGIAAERERYRRIDPRALLAEIERAGQPLAGGWRRLSAPGDPAALEVWQGAGGAMEVRTHADLPLRGRVPVRWRWRLPSTGQGEAKLLVSVDGAALFEARGRWQRLDPASAEVVFAPSGGVAPRQVPGEAWPARVAPRLESLAEGVYRMRGVRTGFHHLVVDTEDGLVVADAPAGWVELAQLPPADLVPGLGVDGLSRRFIEALAEALPGRPLRAVVLTHAHDDHAGGAAAFAQAGARVLAPASQAAFLSASLSRAAGHGVDVVPVPARQRLEDASRPVELIPIGATPHVADALVLWLPAQRIAFQSDLHVAADAPEPPAGRRASECHFARWALATLPEGSVVLGSHALAGTPLSRLREWVDAGACDAAQGEAAAGG